MRTGPPQHVSLLAWLLAFALAGGAACSPPASVGAPDAAALDANRLDGTPPARDFSLGLGELDAIYTAPDLQDCPPDGDGDGWTVCAGDCDDTNVLIHPGVLPQCDGKDNDCDGHVDDTEDHDGDGWAVCRDCNDQDPLTTPGCMEVPGDAIDNNCNGATDEPLPSCDQNLAFGSQNPNDAAAALEVCPDAFLIAAQVPVLAGPGARSLPSSYGIFTPRAGASFTVLSTGVAAAENQLGYRAPQGGTSFATEAPNPHPIAAGCGGADAPTVYDYTELRLTLKVPANALSFSFDFNFLSAEYPEWVCKAYNDRFLALLTSKAVSNGVESNISFDARNNPVTINNGFFTVLDAPSLVGTGYELFDPNVGGPAGAATGWLTTTSPVVPGETITLRFIVFDEGDHILDSAVLLDRFRWSLRPAQAGPSTERSM